MHWWLTCSSHTMNNMLNWKNGKMTTLWFLPLWLSGRASQWYEMLPDATKADKPLLKAAFLERYEPHSSIRWERLKQYEARKQCLGESIEIYGQDLEHLARQLQKPDLDLKDRFILGLRPTVHAFVVLRSPESFAAAYALARQASTIPEQTTIIAEMAHSTTPDVHQSISEIQIAQVDMQNQLKELIDQRSYRTASSRRRDGRVTFNDTIRPSSPRYHNRPSSPHEPQHKYDNRPSSPRYHNRPSSLHEQRNHDSFFLLNVLRPLFCALTLG